MEKTSRREVLKHAALAAVGLIAVLLTFKREAKAGYGRCSRQYCPCQAFEGTGDLCSNCGHPFTDHF